MMAVYRVVLPESHGLDHVRLVGLGLFVRGEAREIELEPPQIRSLKARGFKIAKVRPPSSTEADADPAEKE